MTTPVLTLNWVANPSFSYGCSRHSSKWPLQKSSKCYIQMNRIHFLTCFVNYFIIFLPLQLDTLPKKFPAGMKACPRFGPNRCVKSQTFPPFHRPTKNKLTAGIHICHQLLPMHCRVSCRVILKGVILHLMLWATCDREGMCHYW